MDRIEELRRLEGAATPGPWSVGYDDGSGETSIVAREEEDRLGLDATVVMGGSPEGDITYGAKSPIDAALIVAAVNYVRAALASTERAAGEDWSRLLDYLEVNAPADVDDVIAVLEVRAHRAEKRAAATPDNAGRSPIDVEPEHSCPQCRRSATRRATARAEKRAARSSGGLDAAWAEAEAALPEGWDFGITMTGVEGDGRYHASAAPLSSSFAYRDGKYADADTPAAALRALAARLAKDPTDER